MHQKRELDVCVCRVTSKNSHVNWKPWKLFISARSATFRHLSLSTPAVTSAKLTRRRVADLFDSTLRLKAFRVREASDTFCSFERPELMRENSDFPFGRNKVSVVRLASVGLCEVELHAISLSWCFSLWQFGILGCSLCVTRDRCAETDKLLEFEKRYVQVGNFGFEFARVVLCNKGSLWCKFFVKLTRLKICKVYSQRVLSNNPFIGATSWVESICGY